MITKESSPDKLFIAMNENFICSFGRKTWSEVIEESRLKTKKCIEMTRIIDSTCMKFEILDIVGSKIYRHPLNLFGLVGKRLYRIKFITANPIQLTFDEARSEILDLIIRRRWAGQTGATPAQYRDMIMKIDNMHDLIWKIGFLGRWPF